MTSVFEPPLWIGTTRALFSGSGNIPCVNDELIMKASISVKFVTSLAHFIGSILVSRVALFLNLLITPSTSWGVTGLNVISVSTAGPCCKNCSNPPGSKVCRVLIWVFMLVAILEKYSLNFAATSEFRLTL